MTRPVRVEFRKWDGLRHWTFDATRLGEDEHGVWLGVPVGTLMDRPDARFVLDYPSVVLVPRDQWWVAAFNGVRPPPEPNEIEVYIDMSTPAEWDGDVLRAVDLDLDVVRRWTGEVAVLDEDEFAAHRLSKAYPAHVIAAAEHSARACVDLLRAGAEPFITVFRRYLAQVGRPASAGEALEAHLAAFNAHDTTRLLAGFAPEAVWITGTDIVAGRPALAELFDTWLWSLDPHLDVVSTVVDVDMVAAELRERINVDGEAREFSIAAFFTVQDGLITRGKIYREGHADIGES